MAAGRRGKQSSLPLAGTVLLVGTIGRVIYTSGSYGVFTLDLERPVRVPSFTDGEPARDEGTVSVQCENCGPLCSGMRLRAQGEWSSYRGKGQLKAQFVDQMLGPSATIAAGFLMSRVDGIGPLRAQALVDQHGERLPEVLASKLELMRTPGIGPVLAGQIVERWGSLTPADSAELELAGYGVTPAAREALLERFGARAAQTIRENPWLAVKARGLGFKAADALALRFGVPFDRPERAQAAVLYAIDEAMKSEGSTRHEEMAVLDDAEEGGVDIDEAEAAMAVLVQEGLVVEAPPGSGVVAQAYLDRMERYVAGRLLDLQRSWGGLPGADVVPVVAGINLTKEQDQAVRDAQRMGVLVLTGGPGTGKTTITRAVVDAFRRRSTMPVICCSPTGRAADRLSDATGIEASTIHRLLGWKGGSKWEVNRDDPLPVCLLVVDEVSMVDVSLAYRVCDALVDGSALLLVGDSDQLPSVGPGAVLRDLCRSGAVPVARLSRIMRQAAGNPVIAECHAVNSGSPPRAGRTEQGEVRVATCRQDGRESETPEDVAAGVLATVAGLKAQGLGHLDVQVLCFGKKTACGTKEMNRALRGLWLPQASAEARLVEGERVMQTHNDYDTGVMNGTQGTVLAIDKGRGQQIEGALIRWDGQDAPTEHERSGMGGIEPAWAMTVHKAQGSQYPWVVVALHMGMGWPLHRREVLYTAMSRARTGAVLVGPARAIEMSARVPAGNRRVTGLGDYLAGRPVASVEPARQVGMSGGRRSAGGTR
jgi:exodeoxyribonuclease V alpha subunit